MIGKLMSEAAHSIIGMFSARSAGMESNPSNSDFGSLLLSPEEPPQSGAGETEIEISDVESVDAGDLDAVPTQHCETTNVLPFANQSLGGTIFDHNRSSAKTGQDQANADPVVSDTPDEELSLKFNRDTLQNIRSTAFSVDGDVRHTTAKPASDILASPAKLIPGGGSPIDSAEGAGDADLAVGQTFNDPASQLELNKQAAASAHLVAKAGEQKDARSEPGKFGFRPTALDNLQVTTSLQKPAVIDSEFFDPAKPDVPSAVKSFETSMEQLPLANSSAQLAARETIQKSASFDISSPKVAERLGSEIAEISANGGTKKFEINPRNLGRMEIIFTTRGSREIIEIQTEHQAAKDIIAQHSHALQDILKSQGRDDLTLRIDVKDNIFSSSRPDGGNLAQQESGDGREQSARSSQNRQIAKSFDSAPESESVSDNSRYA